MIEHEWDRMIAKQGCKSRIFEVQKENLLLATSNENVSKSKVVHLINQSLLLYTHSSLDTGSSPGACFGALFGFSSFFVEFLSSGAASAVLSIVFAVVASAGAVLGASPEVFEVVLVSTLRFGVGITISRPLHLQLLLESSVEYIRLFKFPKN